MDAHKFLTVFYACIAKSAPHIYLSALPFTPESSTVAKHFRPHFPDTLSFTLGISGAFPETAVEGVNGFYQVLFSPCGQRMVACSDPGIHFWDAESGKPTSPYFISAPGLCS